MLRVLFALVMLTAACRSDPPPVATPRDPPAPMPVPRTEVAGTAGSDGEIVVVGGLLPDGTASARADIFSSRNNEWARLPDLPVALHHAAIVPDGDDMVVLGGYTMDGSRWVENDRVFHLAKRATEWRELDRMPAPRAAHAAANNAEGEVVVMGGVVSGAVTATTAIFNRRTGWRSGPALATAREHLAAGFVDGSLYAIAGRAGGTNFASVEQWDGSDRGWLPAPSLRHSRGGIGAAVVGRTARARLCVAGGEETAGTIATVECLDDKRWRVVRTLRVARHGLAVAARQDDLHVIGGGDHPGLYVTDVHEVLSL